MPDAVWLESGMDVRKVYRAVTIAVIVISVPLVWGLYKCNTMNIEMAELSVKLEGKPEQASIDRATKLLCSLPQYQNGFWAMVNNPLYMGHATDAEKMQAPSYLQDFYTLLNASRQQAKQPGLPALNEILAEKDQAVAFCKAHENS